MRRGGGDVVYAELRVVETEWEGAQVQIVSLRDITDRKQAQERAQQLAYEREARLEAEAASRAKSEFLAIMSHELRTPLNAVLGYSELMELGISGPLTEKMREQIGRIRLSAIHLLSLVNDILDLAKVEAGRLQVSSGPASAAGTVAAAMALIQPQAAARSLDLCVLPIPEPSPIYLGDDERARQILVNLLSNAVKFTPPGGKITVQIARSQTPDSDTRLQPKRSYVRRRWRGSKARACHRYRGRDPREQTDLDLRSVRPGGVGPRALARRKWTRPYYQSTAGATDGRRPYGEERSR